MQSKPLPGSALVFAACLLFLPAARAEPGDCPQSICVESHTTITYLPQSNMMDAFTTAITDYDTANYYELCATVAVVQLNGPYLVNETILRPSQTPAPCLGGAVVFEVDVPPVPATPGRQYAAFGWASLHVYYRYDYVLPYPLCDPYCDGYWYDAYSYSRITTTQPSSAVWPSSAWTFPDSPAVWHSYFVEIAMNGSVATAWSPPVIYSVIPNQWPAGTPTTFTISGAGFGYSPTLTISGNGITGYTNPCGSAPSAACDTQIVATVSIAANTPGGSVETITVTAGGLNPSGYLPVQISGQSGQVTAQATTQAFTPPVPQIWFNGSNVSNNGTPSCPGNVACVVVGQKIDLTVLIPGITPASHQWTKPTGIVVGGYTPTPQNYQSGQDIPIPNPLPCQNLDQPCLTFYWVTPSAPNAPWQVSYSYTYNNQTSQTVTARFNVAGPAGLQFNGSIDVPDVFPSSGGPRIGYSYLDVGGILVGEMNLSASGTNPAGAQLGEFWWVQLVNSARYTSREVGPSSGTGVSECTPTTIASDPSPALDNKYPFSTGSSTTDSPSITIVPAYAGDVVSEFKHTDSFSTYLLWYPNLPGSIPAPLGLVAWQFACEAVDTLQLQPPPNGTTWKRLCGVPQTPGSLQFNPGSAYPVWHKVALTGPQPFSCQYK